MLLVRFRYQGPSSSVRQKKNPRDGTRHCIQESGRHTIVVSQAVRCWCSRCVNLSSLYRVLDVEYILEDSLNTLIECRKFLRFCYPLAFYYFEKAKEYDIVVMFQQVNSDCKIPSVFCSLTTNI